MAGWDERFCYEDLAEALEVLHRSAYGGTGAELIALLGGWVAAIDLKALLRYHTWGGNLLRRGNGADARYAAAQPPNLSEMTTAKIRKSEQPWDGTWSLLTYDIHVGNNTLRSQLLRCLREMGFAKLSGSSWISPYNWADALEPLLEEVQGRGTFAYVHSAEVAAFGDGAGLVQADRSFVAGRWELDGPARGYVDLARRCGEALGRSGGGAGRARLQVLIRGRQALRSVQAADPMLPAEVLPADWPREDAEQATADLEERVRAESARRRQARATGRPA